MIRVFGNAILKAQTRNGGIQNFAVLKAKNHDCRTRKNVKLLKNSPTGLIVQLFYDARIAKDLDQIDINARSINALATARTVGTDTADHVKSGNAAG